MAGGGSRPAETDTSRKATQNARQDPRSWQETSSSVGVAMRVASVSSLQGVHPKVGMMATMAWYKEWFGEEYLGLYSHRDDQEAEAHIDFLERGLGQLRPRP